MVLPPGSRLGSYELVGLIGAGGMGEVYRAKDLKLGRQVALKILPPAFTSDPERVARFQREAQVLASLNHAHIATIHGLEEANGTHFLVLELVDGGTLEERIARGPLPVDEALEIAKQIAEALEAAHEKGIIHRDLKPSNIGFTAGGQIKVLDFGLAKLAAPTVASTGQLSPSMSPTITSPALVTGRGVLLGTAAYMSPEQAKGKEADKRSDVWAFGCVLYETLTGKRAFGGDDITETLGAVVHLEPTWSDLPEPVARLCRGCLIKNPRERLGDMSAVRFLLHHVEAPASPMTTPRSVTAPSGMRAYIRYATALVAGIGAGIAVAVLGGGQWLSSTAEAPVIRTALAVPPTAAPSLAISDNARRVAISEDGTQVVYVGNAGTRLFVRRLDSLEPLAIASGERLDNLSVSPDGRWVAFSDGRALKKAPLGGGSPIVVAQFSPAASSGVAIRGLAWTSRDTIIFGSIIGLQEVPANGGEVKALTPSTRATESHHWPHLLPGGRQVLFTVRPRSATGRLNEVRTVLLDLVSGAQRDVLQGASDARFVAPRYLVYGSVDGGLYAVQFNVAEGTTVGSPIALLSGVLTDNNGGVGWDVSSDGSMVYLPGALPQRLSPRRLVWVDRRGREEPIPAPVRAYGFPRLSPDGTRIAVYTEDQERDLWTWDTVRHTLSRLTANEGLDWTPVWSPDGLRLFFSSALEGPTTGLAVQAATGAATARHLTQSPFQQVPTAIARDGVRLVFNEMTATAARDIKLLTLDDQMTIKPLIATRFEERGGTLSPDERWIAYESDSSGQFEIYVRPFPNVADGEWQVSVGGGVQPLWSPVGNEIFYRTLEGAIMSAPVRTEQGRLMVGQATRVVPPGYFTGSPFWVSREYDVTRDGQRFVVIKEESSTAVMASAQILMIQGWGHDLARRLSAK